MTRVALIAKQGQNDSGVGRYSSELAHALTMQGCEVMLVHPLVPLPAWVVRLLQRWPGWDLAAFFANYPLWARYPQADVYHLSSQNLATLILFCRPPGPTVITVHDILPYLTRHDASVTSHHHLFDRLFDRIAIWGIGRATMLCAVSEYSRTCLVEQLGIAADKIVVTLEGVRTTR